VIRLALRVRRADAEAVLAELLELAPNGVEETEEGDVIEYAVYGAPGELPALPDLRAAAGEAFVDIHTQEIPDDWTDSWRAFHRPVEVAGRIRVRPPWEGPAADADLVDLVVDPGQAFGTGSHATTRLCLELLLDLPPAGSLADLGCGSGVLAIAAARLGFSPVTALDHEVAAVQATTYNAQVNGVALDVRRWDLRAEAAPVADTILANLLRPLLLELAAALEESPRHLIVSGLLRAECDEVAAAFAARGLHERDRREDGEWAALRLEGPSL